MPSLCNTKVKVEAVFTSRCKFWFLLISFFYCFFCSGFCVATDVQAFTFELKNKLSAKCRGKVETDFTTAVKEICEEYDDKGTEKEDFMLEIDDGKSRSCIDACLKDSMNK